MIVSTLSSSQTATQQVVHGDRNQIIGRVTGGTVIYVSGDYTPPQPKLRPQPIQLAPKPFPFLLGRQSAVTLATHTLPYRQLLAFHGTPGIGKTVLLRYLAHHPAIAPAFPAGLIYLRHRRYQSVSDLLQVLYEAFYDNPIPIKPTDVTIRQAIAGHPALVLLDEAALPQEDIAQLVNELPDLTFVFAAAERQLWGEGQSLELGGLSVEDGIALIARELYRPLNAAEQQAAAAIATALDGHPLQILQAVARAQEEGTSLVTLAQQLSTPKDLLAGLSKPQRHVLALLAMLAGLALAAERIAEIIRVPLIQPLLDQLQRRHLIERTEAGYRGLSEVALETVELAVWRNRTIDCLTQWVQQQGNTSGDLQAADVLFQCLEWAIEAHRWGDAAILGQTLEAAFSLNGQWDAWGHTLRWLLQAAQGSSDRALEGYALHQLGTRALCLNDLTTAQKYLELAREIRTDLNDPGLEATLQNLNYLNMLPPPPPSPPPQEKPTVLSGGKQLMLGGLVAIVGILGYGAWETLKPEQKVPLMVSSSELADIDLQSNLSSLTNPPTEDRTCTSYRVVSENPEGTEAQVTALTVEPVQVRSGELISGRVQLNCEAPEEGLSLTMIVGEGDIRRPLGVARIGDGQQEGLFQVQIPDDYPAGQVVLVATHANIKGASTIIEIFAGSESAGSGSSQDPEQGDSGSTESETSQDPDQKGSGSNESNTSQDPRQAACDHQAYLARAGAILGEELIQISVQNEIDWGQTVTVAILLACPSSEGGSAVQLSSDGDDGFLIQNLPHAILVESEQGTFSFKIPKDGHNYPKGKQVVVTATYDGYRADLPIDIPPFSEPPQTVEPIDEPANVNRSS